MRALVIPVGSLQIPLGIRRWAPPPRAAGEFPIEVLWSPQRNLLMCRYWRVGLSLWALGSMRVAADRESDQGGRSQ